LRQHERLLAQAVAMQIISTLGMSRALLCVGSMLLFGRATAFDEQRLDVDE
jgi:hypothetical protein